MSTDTVTAGPAQIAAALHERIASRTAVVGVMGLGYVGLPACIGLVNAGFSCIGFDIDANKVSALREGRGYLSHISIDDLTAAAAEERFTPTDDFHAIARCDALLITVPTPLDVHHQPDLSFVEATCRAISPRLRRGMLVVLESTTYPGTTREVVIPILEESGLVAGEDFFVGFSPEREDPGNMSFKTTAIPKVVAGSGETATALVEALYRATHAEVVPVASPEVAEASKLLENIFRSVNIAMVNELKVVFAKMGIDIWDVIAAASTKPFGFMPFYPGPGLGGHCIPIDPFYLTWKAKEYEQSTRFIELAGEINRAMPDYVVGTAVRALNEYGKSVKGARILLLGLAYKPDVDDDRESPTYPVMRSLRDMGAEVSFNDPHVPVVGKKREFPEFEGMESAELGVEFDLLVVLTGHSAYRDLDFAALQVPVVDSRNVVPRTVEGLFRC